MKNTLIFVIILMFIGTLRPVNATKKPDICRPTITQTPSATPTSTPDPTPTESPMPSATISPTEAPKEEPKKEERKPDGSVSQPTCDIQKPNAPEFITVDSGVLGDGKLKLLWPLVLNATHVNIIYREYTRGFEHGVANWPNTGNIEITSLKNVNYEFCIQGMNRCAVSNWKCIDPLP